ncbi:MAG TPA: T9SS type A sorting domain-containing protein, partial [Chitinophagales bacterium]|nr:T9SS type A sorting domain-containing protein [Chitinophagales bacterium]
ADVNISCGQTANLTATVSGTVTGATFQWNNGVNTLNNPNVGAGTYSITATNSFGCSSTDAVVVAIPGVSQVLSFNTGLPNNIGCRNVAIQFTNTSSTLANWNWSWNFGDGSGNISFAQNPTYTYTQNGTYTVTLSADSAGCSVQDATKVVTIQTCTGIADSYLSQLIDVYPNPTSGLFTISFREVGSKAAVVNIYDIRGALITEQPVTVNGSDSQKSFTLSKAADGIYFVKIQMGDEVLMKKLILSR